jgi:hypothetical protein
VAEGTPGFATLASPGVTGEFEMVMISNDLGLPITY